MDLLAIAEKSIEISALALQKAEKQVKFSQELYKYGRLNLINVQLAMSRFLNAQIAHTERLKDKYVLMAKALVITNESILP